MNMELTPEEEGARLKALLGDRNKAQFAKENSVPGGPSMLSQHLSGHRPISLSSASAYARGLGVSVEAFSPRLAKAIAEANAAPTSSLHANVQQGPDLRGKVPLISWVQAGAWCQAVDLLPPGESERWMDCPVSHSAGTFALRVRGDSMTAPHGNSRTYPEGSFIFVDPERRNPVNGERVVACLNGTDEVTFKIYKNEDGRQWLQPLNPSHEPIRGEFHILGAVIGKWEDE